MPDSLKRQDKTMEKIYTQEWGFRDFLKFVMPSVVAMLFIALYTIVDGMFVSNFVSTDALAAINIVFPIYNLAFGISIMIAAGSSALVTIEFGRKNFKKANEYFSMVFYVSIIIGIAISVVGVLMLDKIILALGATPRLYDYCRDYALILLYAIPFLMLKILFEYFLRVVGKATLSMISTIIGGVLNIILDYIFIVPLKMGIAGAAYGTAIGIFVSFAIGLIYFIVRPEQLHYGRPSLSPRALGHVFVNGSSEMVTDFSSGITTIVFNLLILELAGEDGVAAITVMLYLHFLFISLSIGVTMGTAPVISFNYGAKNFAKIRQVVRQSGIFIAVSSGVLFILALVLSNVLVRPFVGSNEAVLNLASHGLRLFGITFLISGINIFASGFFTAVGNGIISAIVSFSRSLAFVLIGAFTLPLVLGLDGLWLTLPFAEIITLAITFTFYMFYRHRYLTPPEETLLQNNS